MKKMLFIYIVVALISLLITVGFLLGNTFSVIMESGGSKETFIKDVSLLEFSEKAKESQELFDEISDMAYAEGDSSNAGNFDMVGVGFSGAWLFAWGSVIMLIITVCVTAWIFFKFLFGFIIPNNSNAHKRFNPTYDETIMLFQGTFFVFMASLITAAVSAHIVQLFVAFSIPNLKVHIVYTNGLNYIWGALMIGVVFLVGKMIAQRVGKAEKE